MPSLLTALGLQLNSLLIIGRRGPLRPMDPIKDRTVSATTAAPKIPSILSSIRRWLSIRCSMVSWGATRKQIEQATSGAPCNGCHGMINPLGFTFENYDGIGRWRTTDANAPIDASAEITGTDVDGKVANATELISKIAESLPPSARHAVTQLVRCAWAACCLGSISAAAAP